ncbi:MAG: exodeoxyribonuclease III [Candidatus Competibacterales bacterium]|nr:exodeoxyribonuclease III [Candidatus Competibacterales bacterium]
MPVETTKIATWNVNSLKVRFEHVRQWLDAHQPDLLALQETKTRDEHFPEAALAELGYRAVYAGQKSYNGVALLSREPATDVLTDLPGLDDPQRRVLGATVGGLRVLDLYVPNGAEVGSDKYDYKLTWLDRLAALIETELTTHRDLVVLGDFNIAPADRDVHDPELWRGKVLCSEPERAALRRLLALGLSDLFRRLDPETPGYSWWDYRAAGFRRDRGLRIDLILVSEVLARRCTRCAVDREPRGWERPSDHAPVVAEFAP